MKRGAGMSRFIPFVFLLGACGAYGEWARGEGCPPGEVCSPETPQGLRFESPTLGDTRLFGGSIAAPRLSIGGRSTVRVRSGQGDLFPDFTRPFEARSTTAALGIEKVSPPTVVLRGTGAGGAYLEIAEIETGLLFDRIAVEVAPVARATLRPSGLALWNSDPTFAIDRDGWALFAGQPADVVVALTSPEGGRLVDEEMVIEGPGRRWSWDRFSVSAVPAGSLELSVRTGPFRGTARVDSVDHVDDLSVVGASGGCFRATLGGRLIVNAPVTFESTAPLESFGACVDVTVARGATVALTVHVAGYSETFAVTGGASASAKPSATAAEEELGAPGEVASAM